MGHICLRVVVRDGVGFVEVMPCPPRADESSRVEHALRSGGRFRMLDYTKWVVEEASYQQWVIEPYHGIYPFVTFRLASGRSAHARLFDDEIVIGPGISAELSNRRYVFVDYWRVAANLRKTGQIICHVDGMGVCVHAMYAELVLPFNISESPDYEVVYGIRKDPVTKRSYFCANARRILLDDDGAGGRSYAWSPPDASR